MRSKGIMIISIFFAGLLMITSFGNSDEKKSSRCDSHGRKDL